MRYCNIEKFSEITGIKIKTLTKYKQTGRVFAQPYTIEHKSRRFVYTDDNIKTLQKHYTEEKSVLIETWLECLRLWPNNIELCKIIFMWRVKTLEIDWFYFWKWEDRFELVGIDPKEYKSVVTKLGKLLIKTRDDVYLFNKYYKFKY